MIFFVLGTGYLGAAFLQARSKQYNFIASTTSIDKIPALSLLAGEACLLQSSDLSAMQSKVDRSDGIAIFVSPKTSSDVDIYLDSAKTLSQILQGRKRPFHIIYTSSTFVYAGSHTAIEDTPIFPIHPKASLLHQTEQIYLACQNSWISVSILRLGGIFGPQREIKARAERLSGKIVAGTGDEKTNHIHLEDAVSAAWFCMENSLSGIFNIVNDAHPSRRQLYEGILKQYGLPLCHWDPCKELEHGCSLAVPNHKIKSHGFQFSHPLLPAVF